MRATTKIKRTRSGDSTHEWDEYEVHLYVDGEHVEAATYSTNDKEDAILTAKDIQRRADKPRETAGEIRAETARQVRRYYDTRRVASRRS